MTFLPTDPLDGISISKFAEKFRRGEISSEATTTAYLKRITALDPKIGAFVYVNGDQALATAQAMDRLLAAGTDLSSIGFLWSIFTSCKSSSFISIPEIGHWP